MSRTLFASVLAFGLVAGLAAQQQFSSALREYLPRIGGGMSAAVFADLDGDGDQDLVLANLDRVRLCLNDGMGRLVDATPGHLPALTGSFSVLLTFDADRDGDQDLFLGGYSLQPRLLLNDGGGHFQDATASHLPVLVTFPTPTSLCAGDVDGDGDNDLLLGLNGGRVRLWWNDGSGHFADATLDHLPPRYSAPSGLFLVDLDHDGDLDLVFGDYPAAVWQNDGAGHFTDVTLLVVPPLPVAGRLAVADVDGDGHPDLWLGGATGPDYLLRNDGTGRFLDQTAQRLPVSPNGSWSLCLRDFDGDGAIDAFLGKGDAGERLYRNDGTGRFVDVTATSLPPSPMVAMALAAGDVDRDGRADLLLGGSDGQPWLLINDGLAHFANADPARLPARHSPSETPTALAVGDVDGDQNLDVVAAFATAYIPPYRLALWHNDGTGRFSDVSQRLPFALLATVAGLALGDLDGDGDLDLAVATWQGTSRVFFNDGTGTFTEPFPNLLPNLNASDVRLVDVDGDGDRDIILASSYSSNCRLYRNDAPGLFTDVTATQLPPVLAGRVAAGDLDGDGDLDLVLADASGRNRILVNNGHGFFSDDSAARLPATNDASYAVGLADVDRDGDLDLAFGNFLQQDRLYRNDGRGYFTDVTATHLPTEQDSAYGLAFGDLDGDDWPDLVVANQSRSVVLRNDGSGRFVDVTNTRMADTVTRARVVLLADLCGSGALDLLFGSASQDVLCANRLHAVAAPLLPRLGRGYAFDFLVRPGFAPGGAFVSPYLAAAMAPVPIPVPPVGSWRLHTALMSSLPWVPVPAPSGYASLRLTVPADPALFGVPFFLQGLVVQPPDPSAWRFTNVLADRILR